MTGKAKQDAQRRWSVCFVLLLCLAMATPVRAESPRDKKGAIKAFVSILPQAYFVERIGGNRVAVSVMVGPGQSPATYEPRPKQMAKLSEAKLYFRIGVPFENVWMARISKANPGMRTIDTRKGIELLPMKAGHHGAGGPDRHHRESVSHHDHGNSLNDPHIWLSLRLVKVQARNICDALIAEDPAHADYYEENLKAFHRDLDRLDTEIAGVLKGLKTRKLMIFHPALGYFARDYGLEQLPIEMEGKEPSAKSLARIIGQARKEGIKAVLVQEQFSSQSAEAVARAIRGKVVKVDPLAKEYLRNMRELAQTLAEVMQ